MGRQTWRCGETTLRRAGVGGAVLARLLLSCLCFLAVCWRLKWVGSKSERMEPGAARMEQYCLSGCVGFLFVV